MADVFLSYANEDQQSARRLADLIAANGWSVWWDHHIPAGRSWADVVEAELRGARCVVTLWTTASVTSKWVRKEARLAEKRGVLLPVLLDGAEPPFEFEDLQAIRIVGLDGPEVPTGLDGLLENIALILGGGSAGSSNAAFGRPTLGNSAAERQAPVVARRGYLAAGLLTLALGVAWIFWPESSHPGTEAPSIAVLEFEDDQGRSADARLEMKHLIQRELLSIGGLRVLASGNRPLGNEPDEIADYLLSGAIVRDEEGRHLLRLELSRTSDQTMLLSQLWRPDTIPEGFLGAGKIAARKTSESMGVVLTEEDLSRLEPVRQPRELELSMQAVSLFSRALVYADLGRTDEARELLERVTSEWPEFVEAQQALSELPPREPTPSDAGNPQF